MEDVIGSIENGQWEQAVRLIANGNYPLVTIIRYLNETSPEDSARLISIALSVGYLQIHRDYKE